MATITSCNTIETLLENDGMYPGDPQADSIYEYRQSVTGEVMWAVFYDQAHFDLDTSPYVEEYRCLWIREGGQVAPLGVLGQEQQGEATVKEDLYGTEQCDPHNQPDYEYCSQCKWILDATAFLGFYGCRRTVMIIGGPANEEVA